MLVLFFIARVCTGSPQATLATEIQSVESDLEVFKSILATDFEREANKVCADYVSKSQNPSRLKACRRNAQVSNKEKTDVDDRPCTCKCIEASKLSSVDPTPCKNVRGDSCGKKVPDGSAVADNDLAFCTVDGYALKIRDGGIAHTSTDGFVCRCGPSTTPQCVTNVYEVPEHSGAEFVYPLCEATATTVQPVQSNVQSNVPDTCGNDCPWCINPERLETGNYKCTNPKKDVCKAKIEDEDTEDEETEWYYVHITQYNPTEKAYSYSCPGHSSDMPPGIVKADVLHQASGIAKDDTRWWAADDSYCTPCDV